jgi:hypothetical protein
MFHTVYDSFEEIPGGRDYIGKHSSEDPYDPYLGSFADESFNPTCKIVLGYSKTAEGAVWLEIQWQRVLQVKDDPAYVNQVYQTSTGFDCTGINRSAEYREKQSAIQKEVQNRPEVKEKKSKNITEAVNKPEIKLKHKQVMKEIASRPETIEKRSQSQRSVQPEIHSREEWREKQRESQKISQNKPEVKELKSIKIKERMQDPDVQDKIKSRPNNHNLGRRWFTNGKENDMYFPGEEPSDWRPGRAYNRKK